MSDDNFSFNRGLDQIISRHYLEGVMEVSGTSWTNISREADFTSRLYKCAKQGHERWVNYLAAAKW